MFVLPEADGALDPRCAEMFRRHMLARAGDVQIVVNFCDVDVKLAEPAAREQLFGLYSRPVVVGLEEFGDLAFYGWWPEGRAAIVTLVGVVLARGWIFTAINGIGLPVPRDHRVDLLAITRKE